MSIIIEKAGLFSSFQDFGRHGYEYAGVIPCGALDTLGHEIQIVLSLMTRMKQHLK